MGFQVIIAGGRDFANYELLQNKCDQFFREKRPTAIISGLARGADTLGARYARERASRYWSSRPIGCAWASGPAWCEICRCWILPMR